GRWRAAGVALAATGAGLLGAFWFAIPESRTVIPTRLFVAALAIGLGCGAGAWWAARRPRRPRRRRLVGLAIALAALVLQVSTFLYFGADQATKFVPKTSSPGLQKLIELVRWAN